MNDSTELQELLVRHLCHQGLDEQLAQVFACAVLDNVLTWQVKSACAADECKAIMALAFGYQLSATGSRKPGLVNEALASLVLSHYRRRPRPVYVQSEIAVLLACDVPNRHFHPIKLRKSTNRSHGSTGTESIVAEIAREVGEPQELAPWLLIAHRHHAVRCSLIANEKGFGSVVTPELPAVYDRQSAQIWRRRHLAYLVSDVISRFTMYATSRLYPAILRSDSTPSHNPQDTVEPNPVTSTAPQQPITDPSKMPFQDQLNGEVPLLDFNQDYAAIPCYKPEHTATPPALPLNSQEVTTEQRRGDWLDSTRSKPSRNDAPSTSPVASPRGDRAG